MLRLSVLLVLLSMVASFLVPAPLPAMTSVPQQTRRGKMMMLGMFGKKSAGGKTFTVTVQQKFYKDAELEVDAGAPVNLRKELMKNKIDIYPLQGKIYNCGGGGQCGTCAVQIISGAKNLNPKSPVEVKALGGKRGDDIRLSCCTRASGDVVIKTKP
ncbi:ferredoxin [Nannochloropsis oceanica]